MNEPEICVLCGAPSSNMCQRCLEHYCSESCQMADWAKHKLICTPMPLLVPTYLKKKSVSSRLIVNRSVETSHEPQLSLRRPHVNGNSDIRFERPLRELNPGSDNRQKQRPKTDESGKNVEVGRTSNGAKSNFLPNFENHMKKRPIGMETNIEVSMLNKLDFSLRHTDSDPYTPPPSKQDVDFENSLQNLAAMNVYPKPIIVNTADSAASSESVSTNQPWQTPFAVPIDVCCSVIVQCTSDWVADKLLWVSEQKHEHPLNNLLRDINRNVSAETAAMPIDKIRVGSLVAAPFEDLYYRAEVLDVMLAVHCAVVRLIDYGETFDVPLNQIKEPIPIMKNLNAYAFCIRYSKPTKIGDLIKVQVLEKASTGIYLVEEQEEVSIAKETLNLLQTHREITVGHMFPDRQQFLSLFLDKKGIEMTTELNKILNSEETFKFDNNTPPKRGDFVAGRTSFGWQRTIVLARHDNRYLVYCVDSATLDVLNQVKMIPPEFLYEPYQTLHVQSTKLLLSQDAFQQLTNDEDVIFQLKSLKTSQNENESIDCALIHQNKNIAEVKCSVWNGDLDLIGVDYWRGLLCPEDTVRISHVNSISEIYIALNNLNQMTKLFSDIGANSSLCEKVEIGEVVLMKTPDEKFYRAKIVECIDKDLYNVHVIDYGSTSTVALTDLRKSNLFCRGYPVYTTKVRLSFLGHITTPIPNNKALAELKRHCEMQQTFTLKFDKNLADGVELFSNDNTGISLNKELLPLVFEAEPKALETKKEESVIKPTVAAVPVCAIPTSSAKFMLTDVEVIPLPTGNKVELLVLDDSAIEEGYFTGCSVSDSKHLEKLEMEYTPKIQKYCKRADIEQAYNPELNEICLAVFNEDGAWYRAFCISVASDAFTLMFLDYGNVITQRKDKIRKIPKELMFSTNANTCSFDNFTKTTEAIKQIKEKVKINNIVIASNVSKIDDGYIVKMDI